MSDERVPRDQMTDRQQALADLLVKAAGVLAGLLEECGEDEAADTLWDVVAREFGITIPPFYADEEAS